MKCVVDGEYEAIVKATVAAGGMADASSALEAADLPPDSRLVWKPFRGSRSMSDPFWELSGRDALVYVDQRGRVWRSLERGTRGG